MGSNHHPRKERFFFIHLWSHSLTYSDKVVARYQLYSGENTVFLSHTWVQMEGDQKALEPGQRSRSGGPLDVRQGLWHCLGSPTTGIYPTGLWGCVPAKILSVCNSEWHLAFHFGSHEINQCPVFSFRLFSHGNENVTVPVLQEKSCLTLNESTEALNL